MFALRRTALFALACLCLSSQVLAGDAWSELQDRLTRRQKDLSSEEAEALGTVMRGEALAEIIQAWEHSKLRATESALYALDLEPMSSERGGQEYTRSREAVMETLRKEDLPPGTMVRFIDYSEVALDQGYTRLPTLRTHVVKTYEGDIPRMRFFLCDLETGRVVE